MIGQVFKAVGGKFWVDTEQGERVVNARGRLQQNDGQIIVGDFVEFDQAGAISKVLERKNSLVRPEIANIQSLIVIIAPTPAPDFYLIDKLIVHCCLEKLDMVLCVNKSDLSEHLEIFEYCKRAYLSDVAALVQTSALNGEIDQLKPHLKNHLSCLCGQSAAGKTTLINSLLQDCEQEVGELSKKIARGRHTTRASKVFHLDFGGLIADTPGFSRLSVDKIFPDELNYFYQDYVELKKDCGFSSCLHLNEPVCAVRDAAREGRIDPLRYERYKEIYLELVQKRKKNSNYNTIFNKDRKTKR